MIDWSTCTAVERDPELLHGAWVFRGTRVPVAALFENLEDDIPIDQFVALFPGVTLMQARAALEHAARYPDLDIGNTSNRRRAIALGVVLAVACAIAISIAAYLFSCELWSSEERRRCEYLASRLLSSDSVHYLAIVFGAGGGWLLLRAYFSQRSK